MKPILLAGIAFFLAAVSTQAAELIESYTAVLSERDHFNSSGERLTSPAAIIRQDRANFHKFGKGDDGDGTDGYFANAKNRAELEKMIERGAVDPAARRAIVNGTPVVVVQIFRGKSGDFVNVALFN